MSIAVLHQVYDEARRLTIAGSGLAVGDFRLKKLIDPLKKAGAKAPVFAKVAAAVEAVVDGNEKSAPQALIDLNSLVLAIIYTQGQTGLKGKSKEIESVDIGVSTTQVSSRVLKPLLEALTSTGSGRLETVQDALQRGAFQDLRLVNPAINALDDGYPELADYVAEQIVPQYGNAILPEIVGRIDIKGRAGNVRRLKLLYRLDPKRARPIVEEAFEKGSKEMKIAALSCLGDSQDDLPHLLEQAKAKTKDVRRVAIERLGRFQGAEVEAIFQRALAGADIDLVATPVNRTKNAKLVRFAQEQTTACLDELLATKDKKKLAKLIDRLDTLLWCFYQRKEKSTRDLLKKIFQRRDEIIAVKNAAAILSTLYSVMVASADKELLNAVAAIHGEIDDDSMDAFASTVYAVFETRTPKQVYDELHGYYSPGQIGRLRSKVDHRSVVIEGLLSGDPYFHWRYNRFMRSDIPYEHEEQQTKYKIDPRWLDLAIAGEDVETVCQFAGSMKHTGIADFLVSQIEPLQKERTFWPVGKALATLIDLKDRRVTDLILDVISTAAKKKKAGHDSLSYSIFPLVSRLPKASAGKVEAVMQGYPDSVVDQMMPHLLTLKQK